MFKHETHLNSPNFTPAAKCPTVFGGNRLVRKLTIHHWGDPATSPTFDGVVAHLMNPKSGVSAHEVIEEGRVSTIVDPDDAAWSTGHRIGNLESIALECHPRASKGDIATVAERIADYRNFYGDLLIVPHSYWVRTACPGKYNVFQLDTMSYDILWKKYRKRF